MVQSLDIRSDGYYLIWFFTPLRVKYDWGFRLFDDGLVMENIYQKLHLAYLKFMSLITFNISLRNSAKGGELFGGSLLQNFIKSDKNKIIPFYHNDMVWLINLFSFRGELRGWKAKHETQKKRRGKQEEFIHRFYQKCHRLLWACGCGCSCHISGSEGVREGKFWELREEKNKKRRKKIHRKIWLWFNWYSWWQLIESHWKFVSNQWPWR